MIAENCAFSDGKTMVLLSARSAADNYAQTWTRNRRESSDNLNRGCNRRGTDATACLLPLAKWSIRDAFADVLGAR